MAFDLCLTLKERSKVKSDSFNELPGVTFLYAANTFVRSRKTQRYEAFYKKWPKFQCFFCHIFAKNGNFEILTRRAPTHSNSLPYDTNIV